MVWLSSSGAKALTWSITAVVILVNSIFAALFLQRWRLKDPRIVIRNPYATLFILLSVTMDVGLYGNLLRNERFAARFIVAQNAFLLSFVIAPYVLKTFELYFRFNLAEEIFAIKKNQPLSPNSASEVVSETAELTGVGWFVKRKYLISIPFEAAALCIWTCIAFSLISLGYTWNKFYFDVLLYIFCLGTIIFFFWKLRGKVDVWGIKRELRNTLLYAVITLMVYIGIWFFGLDNQEILIITFIVFTLFLESVLFETIARPILKYLTPGLRDIPSKASYTSPSTEEFNLANLLKFPEFVTDFEQWLTKALSAENLSFIREVQAFEDEITLVDRFSVDFNLEKLVSQWIHQANRIIRLYIDNKSAIILNLSYDVRVSTLTEFKAIKTCILQDKNYEEAFTKLKTLFKCSKQEIFALLESDSLPRYMATEHFRKFKENYIKVGVIEVESAAMRSNVTIKGLIDTVRAHKRTSSRPAIDDHRSDSIA